MLTQLKLELEQLAALGPRKEFHPVLARDGGYVEIRGKKLVDFTSWDSTNINQNKKFIQSLHAVLEERGVGSASARFVTGTSREHISCEARIAKFLGTGSALLFSSRNQAVFSLITAVVGERDSVFAADSLQSPVSDACYLVNAALIPFRDIEGLERELQKVRGPGRKIIFVEALSPHTGEVAALPIYAALAQRYGAYLFVDEGVAIGSIGLRGAGGCEAHNLIENVWCRIGDLSLGLGCYGAFIAGDAVLVTYIMHRSRTLSGESALPAVIARAAENAIDIIELQQVARERLLANATLLTSGLRSMGLSVAADILSPIVCFQFSEIKDAYELADSLFARGFLVHAFSSGAQLSKGGLVRLIMNAAHSEREIGELLIVLAEIQTFSKK